MVYLNTGLWSVLSAGALGATLQSSEFISNRNQLPGFQVINPLQQHRGLLRRHDPLSLTAMRAAVHADCFIRQCSVPMSWLSSARLPPATRLSMLSSPHEQAGEEGGRVAESIKQLQAAIACAEVDAIPAAAYQQYLDYYRLPSGTISAFKDAFKSAQHQTQPPEITAELSSLSVGSEQIAVQIFRNLATKAAGEVVLVHGYQDHVGVHYALIDNLLQRGHTVYAFDLQGHGLSTGKRCAIATFDHYRAALEAVLELTNDKAQLSFVAHSTGCSVLIEHILSSGATNPTVLICPLIRNRNYDQGVKLYKLAEKLALRKGVDVDSAARQTPSGGSIDSDDPEQITFAQQDPLRGRMLTASWFGALIRWQVVFDELPGNPQVTPLVIQGDKDQVVNYEYNLPLIAKKFEHAQIGLMPDVGHQIMNERPAVVQNLNDRINGFLAGE